MSVKESVWTKRSPGVDSLWADEPPRAIECPMVRGDREVVMNELLRLMGQPPDPNQRWYRAATLQASLNRYTDEDVAAARGAAPRGGASLS